MESPDVVDTSDAEEREVLAFHEDMVCFSGPTASPPRAICASAPQSAIAESNHFLPPGSLLTLTACHGWLCEHGMESPSPRKRVKLAHDADAISPSAVCSLSVKASPKRTRCPEVPRLERGSLLKHPGERMFAGDEGQPRPDTSQSLGSCPTFQQRPHSSSRSLSISTSHDSLFSSPYNRTTPPQTSSRHSDHLSNIAGQKPYLAPSSPLTPLSSATFPQSPSQTLGPVQTRHPGTQHSPASRSSSPPAVPRLGRSPPVQSKNSPQPLGRYSLRRREAWQLNPYAYDKLLYKQQLKSHPDAIVKFRSPQRRPGSGGVGNGTQDEFLFPVDNLDEDGDYVDAESEGRRRNKPYGSDRDDELGVDGRGSEVERMDKGWLPEALKGLSSSDEDDDEIRKLARSIRRDRERAEAKAKAGRRRAAAEARKVEMETRGSLKKRIKPFPVIGKSEAARFSQSSLIEPSQPYLFSRAHSEPTVAPCPSPPKRSTLRPSRASSHSPSLSSGPSRLPDFSVYLQQEDSYLVNDNDYEELFLWNRSPTNHSSTHSAPSSPFGPPTTSGASALPSNTSGVESESDQQSVFAMSSKDRKRLRALKRMMPAAMITRQLGATNAERSQPSHTRAMASSSGSEAEEVRAIPGAARVRKGRYRDAEVRGDPESSDVGHPMELCDDGGERDAGAVELPSDGRSAIRRHSSLGFGQDDGVISLSDGSTMESSENSGNGSSDDEQACLSPFERPARGPARERSLIDWMLTRTRNSGESKFKFKRPTGQWKARGSRVPRLDIVTSGARRYGEQHQTLLPFVRTDPDSKTNAPTKRSLEREDRTMQPNWGTVEERKKWRKKWKQQLRTNQGPVYNVHHDATRITSRNHERKGGRGSSALVIKHDDNEFRQALDPEWRAEVERWNKSVSPARHPTRNLAISAPTAPRPRLYRRTSPQLQHEILLPSHFQREEPSLSIHHHIVIDMNITPLPSGIKFADSSYIGKGSLHQLIVATSGNSEVAQPIFCNAQGFEIGPTTSAAAFSAFFGPLCDRLVSVLRRCSASDADMTEEWRSMTRASNQLLSWLTVHAEDQEFIALEVVLQEYLDGLLLVLDALETNAFTLFVHWFVVELFARLATGVKYRRGSVENGYLIRSAKQLIRRLSAVDLQSAFVTFRAAEGDVDDAPMPTRAAELWVCLIHLLPNFEISPEVTVGHPLWRLLTGLYTESFSTGAEASEDVWRTIFCLCALSQFSVHGLSTSVFRLPAAWGLVAIALRKIVLTANPEKERLLPKRAIKKRDDYVSYVVSRCFLLWNQWNWRLDDGIVMFKSLQEIFRSRNFANLVNERSAPMGFFENSDLELLSKRDPHDTVFEMFLKMVVQAVHALNTNVELDPKQRSVNIKKLLQMAVPVSPVPPSARSLSMLVNRFSAMAVALHLDPTFTNVKFRIGQAMRCVSFRDADDQSRVACVYGMMNFAMIVNHHKITGGLGDVLEWLGEMADVLMDEYKESEASAVRKKMTTTLIQLLLGSVRRVIETQSLDKGQSRAEYPDPALLNGSWVTRVFNPRTDLVTIQQTGVEIRMLVQSFLNARLKALPEVQPPPPPVIHSAETQESQDEYDRVFLELNDEELLAALGDEAEASAVADLKSKEDALCKVLEKSITPAVYRLVCKHFGESETTKNGVTRANDQGDDEWIDCWVGCANVLVQNNYKDWGLYTKLGQQSWEKIIDDSWRRRVGLRFNLTLLRLDPRAYRNMKDDFIAVLMMATVSHKTTIEHEFISVVLSLDGLQHPLLRGAPLEPVPGTKKYEVGKVDYEAVREWLIETIFENVAGCLRARVDAKSQSYVELMVVMLSTMRDIYQELGGKRAGYGEFCQRVLHIILGHPELASHQRMSAVLDWGRKEWAYRLG